MIGLRGIQKPHQFSSYELRERLDAHQVFRVGVLDGLEIGEDIDMTFAEDRDPEFNIRIRLAYNTIPLRGYGPKEATDHEYFHGYTLKEHEFRGIAEYRLPTPRREAAEFSPNRIYPIPQTPFNAQFDLMQPNTDSPSKDSTKGGSDISAHFYYGLTDWLTLSDHFKFRRKESLFANQFTTTVNVAEKQKLSFSYMLRSLEQNELEYRDRDIFTFALSFFYRGVLAGNYPFGINPE